jgi:hypothetical protein
MSFIRHVGRHGDRKVAIAFREVPGEPHMALVIYTELLNQNIHDPLIACIESDIGQNSDDLALALNRVYTKDGQIILQKLHAEGMLKKVNTEVIVMTPAPNTRIKLSELNKILDEMKMGESAVKRLAEMDNQLGMHDALKLARRMRGDSSASSSSLASEGALGDNVLVSNLRQQAERMKSEASGLLAEADRLLTEAAGMDKSTTDKSVKVKKDRVKKNKAAVVA